MADEMQKGQWSNPKDLGVVATHSILLHTGKVLMFSFDEKNATQPRKVNAKVFDPMTEEVIPVDRPPEFPKPRNLFCSGHCMLPDGRLLVVGGNDWYWGPHYDVHTFHPETLSWTEHKSMRKGRYYPTCTTLPDGTVFISSGAKFRFLFGIVFINKSYEIFDSQKNSLTHKGRFASGRFLSMYPFVHVLPSGDLFVHSKNETRLFDPRTFTWRSGNYQTQSLNTRAYPGQGACVLLPLVPDKPNQVRLLVVGGADETKTDLDEHTRATDMVEIFTYNPKSDPTLPPTGWRTTTPLFNRRFMPDAVLLPDGTVLIISGAAEGSADNSHDAILEPELFHPEEEKWTRMAEMKIKRLYHATAILLPDARVLVGGTTSQYNPEVDADEFRIQVFSPPYLSKGPQPVITSTSTEVSYGDAFDIVTPDAADIESVPLIRPSSVTHSNNMDQRFVGLKIHSPRDPDKIRVTAPKDANIAPPGYYMLFIVNGRGIPSVAKFIRLS